jgi:hypothetical protein
MQSILGEKVWLTFNRCRFGGEDCYNAGRPSSDTKVILKLMINYQTIKFFEL